MSTYLRSNFNNITNTLTTRIYFDARTLTGTPAYIEPSATINLLDIMTQADILDNAKLLRMANSGVITVNTVFDLVPSSGYTWQDAVKAKRTTNVGLTPVKGDRYLVIATATDSFAGHAKSIAEYNGSSWEFYVPQEGWAVLNVADDTGWVYYSAAWVQFSGSGAYEVAGAVATHNALATGVHGVAGGTVAKVADIASDGNLSSAAQAVVTAGACDVDANLSSAAQAVVTAGACDVDANLSSAAQSTIGHDHAQYSDLTKLQKYESAGSAAGGGDLATQTLVCTGVLATDTLLVAWNSTAGATPANDIVIACSILANDSISVTWIGAPGVGTKVTVYVKQA